MLDVGHGIEGWWLGCPVAGGQEHDDEQRTQSCREHSAADKMCVRGARVHVTLAFRSVARHCLRASHDPGNPRTHADDARYVLHTVAVLVSSGLLNAAGSAQALVSFPRAQAEQGSALYARHCAQCHGAQLVNGTASPLAGRASKRAGRSPRDRSTTSST